MKRHLTFPTNEEKKLTPCQWDDKSLILDGDTWDYICENLDGHITDNTLRNGYAVSGNIFWKVHFGSFLDNWVYFEADGTVDPYKASYITRQLLLLNNNNTINHVSVHYEDETTVIVAKYYYRD